MIVCRRGHHTETRIRHHLFNIMIIIYCDANIIPKTKNRSFAID